MKLSKSIQIKETTILFSGKYNYKIVLVCPAADWFRSKKYDITRKKLNQITSTYNRIIRNKQDLDYCYKVLEELENFNNEEYNIRIENPLISVYTNNSSYIEKLAAIDENVVKFVCLPSKNIKKIDPGKVVVKTLDYDYKVYLATIKNRDNKNFLNWVKNNNKIRITKRCIRDLNQLFSWGGSYFYVKGDKTLTMVKMLIGKDISRIEQVIKV